VDACTVTALDAITAFAVPNPNGHLAAPSVFSGLEVQSGRPAEPITQLFQVTRFRSQTPRRHATAQSFAPRIAGRRPFNSPPLSFERDGSMPPGSPASFPGWNRRLEAAFHSPGTTARFQATIPRSKLPTCSFDHPAVRSSCPFGFRFPHALRFAPTRAGSLPKSRCLTPVRHSQPFLGSPLPFGAFRTLKDQRVQPDSWPGSSPSKRSRLPITPWPRFYFISSDTRSPLQAR